MTRVNPSVVNIHSEKTSYNGESLFQSGRGRKVSGMGTGIVVDERGYIVTNYHVVQGVDSLRATMNDGGTYSAQVISYDRVHDLAVVKVNPSQPLTVAHFGVSMDVMLGETVFAVGNAFGYEHTLTKGVVSALSRDVEVNEKQAYKNLIQTDASINPGNSGGPLCNLDGEVIGINVAIRAGAQRIGFAIPIDDARKIIARLLSIEELNSLNHGVIVRDIKTADRQELIVEGTQPSGPGNTAGLLKGDIFVKAGSIMVADSADLERALLGRTVGETVTVEVRRGAETKTLELTLAKSTTPRVAATPTAAAMQPPVTTQTVTSRRTQDESAADKAWKALGIRLAPLAPRERQLVSPRYRGGMRVSEIRRGSPAVMNGMQIGDILVGLHVWETLNSDNISYVMDHPQLSTFSPLKFYIVRKGETLFGHMPIVEN
ncbi:MAG: trypsin-like peptidase domain-containing protein [Planctomycetota bacterium]|nr:trypsin-like peptidase domain-containing protein [Planctomycetota bacterium]